MANLKLPEILIILAIVLLLFGSKKLPDAARGIGRSLRIFKAETKGLMEDDKQAVEGAATSTPAAAAESTPGEAGATPAADSAPAPTAQTPTPAQSAPPIPAAPPAAPMSSVPKSPPAAPTSSSQVGSAAEGAASQPHATS